MTAPPTRVCRLTPIGRGAVAVVDVAGPAAVEAVARHFRAAIRKPLAAQPLSRIVYGQWGEAESEDLVVTRRPPDNVEVHCHGGPQSSSRIVADLVAAGCVESDWRECNAGRLECPLAAAAQVALADVTTLRAATILLDQYHGALRREVLAIQTELLSQQTGNAADRLEKLVARAEFGLHLSEPWQVVVAGKPNVGKSSLINAMVGYQRAIVFDEPGTTRDVISATTAIDGWPVELSDTAGLQATTDKVESAGIALARKQLKKADVVLWVVDATELSPGEAPRADTMVPDIDWDRALVIVNKIDLIDNDFTAEAGAISTCATSGVGVERLQGALATRLVPFAPSAGAAVPFNSLQVEFLTDALNACQRDDLPAATDAVSQLLQSDR